MCKHEVSSEGLGNQALFMNVTKRMCVPQKYRKKKSRHVLKIKIEKDAHGKASTFQNRGASRHIALT